MYISYEKFLRVAGHRECGDAVYRGGQWGLVVLAREYPCGPEVAAAARAVYGFSRAL